MDKIGLIEDDDVLRSAYAKYFKISQTFEVIFSVPDIVDAIALKVAAPQIILLDINLRSGSGLDGIELLKNKFPESKIVILSSLENAKLTHQAMDGGATGYLLKTSSLPYIAESLQKINEGGMPLSPAVVSHVMQPKNYDVIDEYDDTGFTKRELELIKLLSEGHANKTAADKLNVTYFTINQHLKNIYKKLHINSKSELISWYLNRKR
jgi:DNA-binding NarL/FixJ family response regulator